MPPSHEWEHHANVRDGHIVDVINMRGTHLFHYPLTFPFCYPYILPCGGSDDNLPLSCICCKHILFPEAVFLLMCTQVIYGQQAVSTNMKLLGMLFCACPPIPVVCRACLSTEFCHHVEGILGFGHLPCLSRTAPAGCWNTGASCFQTRVWWKESMSSASSHDALPCSNC